MSNVVAVWKPRGPSSNQFLNRIRAITGVRKIGHAGTLDPLAEGVLVIGIGNEGTKALAQLVANEKEYRAEIRLGVSSTTDDEEGEKMELLPSHIPTRQNIEVVLRNFVGAIHQVPPVFSAIKVSGQRAYRLARAGKPLKLAARSVIVKEIELVDYNWPNLALRVVTGPGVYIRSLARDIGVACGGGGYLTGLTRIRVGDFSRTEVVSLEGLVARFRSE